MVAASQLIGEITIKDSASAVADRVTSAMERTAAAEEKVSTGAATSTRQLESAAKQFERLRAAADPAYAANQRFANQQQQLARAVELGVASEREATLVTQQLQAQLNGGTGSFSKYGMAIQNSSFQVADFATQVAGGTSPMRAMAQQLPQLLGGFGVLGAALSAVVAVGGALAPMFIAWANSAHGAALSTDELNKTLKEMDALQKQISGNSERNRASIQAELNYRLSTVQATYDELKKRLDAMSPTITSQQRYSTQPVTTDNPAYKQLYNQLIEIQGALEKAKQDAGQFRDAFAKMGTTDGAGGASSTVKSLQEVIAARMEAVRVAKLNRQEGDADKLVDQDLATLGFTRASANKELLQTLTQLATTQVAATKAGKDAEEAQRKSLENIKEVSGVIAGLQKQYDELNKSPIDQRVDDLFAGRIPTDADIAKAKALVTLIDKTKFDQQQDKAFVSEIDQDIADLTRGAQEQSQWWEKSLATQQETVAQLQLQLSLAGANDNVQQSALAHLQAQQQVHAQIGDTMTENGRKFIENADKIAQMNQQLQKQKVIAQELPNFFDQAFDRIGSAITQATATGEIGFANLLDVGKAVVSELEQEFLKLALINPLKNLINGNNSLPDLSSVGSKLFDWIFGGGGGTTVGGGAISIPATPTVHLAAGGPAAAGNLYRVNENGMEYFRPNVSGVVIPMGAGAGNSGTVVQVIDQRGANAPAVQQTQSTGPDGRQLIRIFIKEAAQDVANGGMLGQAINRRIGASPVAQVARG